jgi:hypothetical protein
MKTIDDIWWEVLRSCGNTRCTKTKDNPCCDMHHIATDMILRGEY